MRSIYYFILIIFTFFPVINTKKKIKKIKILINFQILLSAMYPKRECIQKSKLNIKILATEYRKETDRKKGKKWF